MYSGIRSEISLALRRQRPRLKLGGRLWLEPRTDGGGLRARIACFSNGHVQRLTGGVVLGSLVCRLIHEQVPEGGSTCHIFFLRRVQLGGVTSLHVGPKGLLRSAGRCCGICSQQGSTKGVASHENGTCSISITEQRPERGLLLNGTWHATTKSTNEKNTELKYCLYLHYHYSCAYLQLSHTFLCQRTPFPSLVLATNVEGFESRNPVEQFRENDGCRTAHEHHIKL